MATVVVVGGSGFIGRPTVRRLVEAGEDVVVMTAHPERSASAIERLGARVVVGDVRDAGSLPRGLEGADVVVQSLTFPSFPVEKPSKGWTFEAFEHLAAARLAAAAGGSGVRRYVYVSGVNVTPEADKVWYRAKWEAEQVLAATDLDVVIVRPSWVYGPEDRALNRLVTFARLSPFVPVIGDGSQLLNPVFVDDVASVLAQAAQAAGPTGTFEIGGPQTVTMNGVLRTMLKVMGKHKPLVHVPEGLPRLGGAFLRYLPMPPLSPDAIDFAIGSAVADTRGLLEAFDVELTTLEDGLGTYLSPG